VTGSSPVGSVALVLAVVVGTAVGGAALGALPADRPTVAATLAVDPAADRLTLTHRAGEAVDVRRLTVEVSVDGRPLAHQPPVPFFAARGFRAGPTGPFNARADPVWTAGERATLRLAATNRPALAPGVEVTVALRVDGALVTRVTARA
jgi:hypothetical protein